MPELLAENPIAVAEVMMNRALDAIEACPTSDPIAQSYVVVGELAWDDCCGLLVGVPLRTFRSVSFPLQVTDVTNCDGSFLCVDIAVVLLRCAPVVDEVGNLPSPDVMTAEFTKTAKDAAVIMDAMAAALPEGWERANLEQAYEGADGGCIVIDTRMTIGLPQTDWCVDCGTP